jgi:hypothetical protein
MLVAFALWLVAQFYIVYAAQHWKVLVLKIWKLHRNDSISKTVKGHCLMCLTVSWAFSIGFCCCWRLSLACACDQLLAAVEDWLKLLDKAGYPCWPCNMTPHFDPWSHSEWIQNAPQKKPSVLHITNITKNVCVANTSSVGLTQQLGLYSQSKIKGIQGRFHDHQW